MVDLATDPSSRRRRRRHTTARATTESSLSRSMQEILGIPCFDNDLSSSFNVDNSNYVNGTSSNLSQCERTGGTRHRRRGSIDMLGGAPLNNDERHQPSAFRTLEGHSPATPATQKKPKYNMGKSPVTPKSPGIVTDINTSTTATDAATSNSPSRSRRLEITSPGSGRPRRTLILSPTSPVTPPVTSAHDRLTLLTTTSRRDSDTSTPTTPTGRGRRRLSPQSSKLSTETIPKSSESPRRRFRQIPKLGHSSPHSPSNAANVTTTTTAPIAEDQNRSSPLVKGDWYLSIPETSVTSAVLRKRRDDMRRSSPPPSITTASSVAMEQTSGHSRRSRSHHSRTSTTSDRYNGGVGTLLNLVKGGTPKAAKKTLKTVSDRIQKLSNHHRTHKAHSYHSRSVTVDDRPIPYSTMSSTRALDDRDEAVDDHFHSAMLSIGTDSGDPMIDRQPSTVKFFSGPRLKAATTAPTTTVTRLPSTSSIGLPPKSPSSRSRRSGITDDLLHQCASTISLAHRSPNISDTSGSNRSSTASSPSTKKASLAQTLLSQKKSPRSLQASMNGLIVGVDVDRGTPNKSLSAGKESHHQTRKNEKLTLPSMLPF